MTNLPVKSMIAALLAGVSIPTAVLAQTAPADTTTSAQDPTAAEAPKTATATPQGESTDIVVTAQKREQRLLDVPVAVSAVSSESLTTQNLVSIRDYYSRIPGIQLSGPNVQNLSLRGVNAGGLTNPTVAILIDDVQYGSSSYLGNPPIPDLDPATLERVEVLRGPQGTLYGASSLGGLIKYVTRTPNTTEVTGRLEIGANTVEDGGQGFSARGSINLPIVRDRIGLTVSGFYRDDPRYIDYLSGGTVVGNTYVGGVRRTDANKVETYGGRAALVVNVTDNFTITGSALRQKQKAEGTPNILLCSTCSATTGGAVTFDSRYANLDERTTVAATPASSVSIALYTGRAELDLGGATLTSVSAWGKNVLENTTDGTSRFARLLEGAAFGSLYPVGATYLFAQPITTTKFTQEVRIASTGAFVDVLAGGFYTKEHSNFSQIIQRVGVAPLTDIYSGENITSYDEKAVFGDLTFHPAEGFDVQVGGRYARNKQVYDVVSTIDGPAQALFGPGESAEYKFKEGAFTWLVTPSYRFNPDMLGYIRVASGYRPGGPNTQTPGVPATFGHDTVLNYEAGLKGYVLDRRVSIDLSVFQIDWDDIQLQNTALPSQFVFIANGKKARSRGIEFATTVRPWKGMSIDANATLLDAALTRSLDRSTATIQRLRGEDGDRLPYSAKFTGNVSVQQDFVLGNNLGAYAGFNVNYVGNRMGLFNQDAAAAIFDRVRLPAYTIVDLRAGFSIQKQWRLGLYARNIFDKQGLTAVDTRNGAALPEGLFVTPRTLGFTVSGDF